jgi:hypothetical protein
MGDLATLGLTPKIADMTLNGVNAAARAVAENPSVRSGIGYTAGALAGGPHPFIGARIGNLASGLLTKPATEIANATDWLKNKVHGEPPDPRLTPVGDGSPPPSTGANIKPAPEPPPPVPSGPVVPPELRDDYAALVKAHGPALADRWLQQQLNDPRAKPVLNDGQAPVLNLRPTAPAPDAPPLAKPTAQPAGPVDRSAVIQSTLDDLTRRFGRGEVGKFLNPDAPEATTGALLRTGAPRPSSLPDNAWQSLKRDLVAGSSNDPARTVRTLTQLLKEHARNGEASTVPQRLSELLKAFEKPGGQ